MTKLFIFIFSVILISCTTTNIPKEIDSKPEKVETLSITETKKRDADKIFFKTLQNKKFSAKELSQNKISVFHITASWCEPCKQLAKRLNDLRIRYYNNKILFFTAYLKNDILPDVSEDYFPQLILLESPEEIGFENSDIFPRLIVFDSNGDISAIIDGLYPTIYYYVLFEEILNKN